MAILASSREVEASIYAYNAHQTDEAKNRCIELFNPFVISIAEKHPQWLRDDLQQELRLYLHQFLPALVRQHQQGKVRKLLQAAIGMLDRAAITIARKQFKEKEKFTYIDDLELEILIRNVRKLSLPSEEDSVDSREWLLRVRKVVMEMMEHRFSDDGQSRRATRWIQVLLQGQRPMMMTQVIAKFNHSRYQAAKHMYSIVLHNLRAIACRSAGEPA